MYDPSLTDHLFLALASQPLADFSADAWAEDLLAAEGCSPGEPLVVDGAEGVIGTDCNLALISTDDRGYLIWLYVSGDDPEVFHVHDRSWFDQMLGTVQLSPQDARSGYAAEFRLPFGYVLPDGPEFDYGTTNETWFEIRVPAFAEAGHPGGVILQAIRNGLVDPCDTRSNTLPIEAGPQAVIDYLKTVRQIEVSDEAAATVGDMAAVEATIVATPTSGCSAVRPFLEHTEPVPADIPLRIVAFDVGDEHLLVTIFGDADNPTWASMADELIDSFQFQTE